MRTKLVQTSRVCSDKHKTYSLIGAFADDFSADLNLKTKKIIQRKAVETDTQISVQE